MLGGQGDTVVILYISTDIYLTWGFVTILLLYNEPRLYDDCLFVSERFFI